MSSAETAAGAGGPGRAGREQEQAGAERICRERLIGGSGRSGRNRAGVGRASRAGEAVAADLATA
jgi:hypothetical protein